MRSSYPKGNPHLFSLHMVPALLGCGPFTYGPRSHKKSNVNNMLLPYVKPTLYATMGQSV